MFFDSSKDSMGFRFLREIWYSGGKFSLVVSMLVGLSMSSQFFKIQCRKCNHVGSNLVMIEKKL